MENPHNSQNLPQTVTEDPGLVHLKNELSPDAVAELMQLASRPQVLAVNNVHGDINYNDKSLREYIPANRNYNYFNLFVIEGNELVSGHFQMNADVCLSEDLGTDKGTARWLKKLLETEREEVKSFPAVVATANRTKVKDCHAGFLYNIDIQRGAICFDFKMIDKVTRDELALLSHKLHLIENPRCEELDTIHWAVKNANLISTLRRNGKELSPLWD